MVFYQDANRREVPGGQRRGTNSSKNFSISSSLILSDVIHLRALDDMKIEPR